jgi:hypothetical protein
MSLPAMSLRAPVLDPDRHLSDGFHALLTRSWFYPGTAEILECNAIIAAWGVEQVSDDFQTDKLDLENRVRALIGMELVDAVTEWSPPGNA